MSGLEFIQAIKDGELPQPPIAKLLGYTVGRVARGEAVFEIEPQEFLYNPIGMVHGGVACTLLDTATACAIHTTLEAGVLYTTVEIKVNFIRPIKRTTGRLSCEAKAIHVGKRIATAEGQIFDSRRRLFAHAVSTCLIFSSRT